MMHTENQSFLAEKTRVARYLARKHFESESGLTHIFRLSSGAEAEATELEPIKLLEVNEDTFASGLYPLHFGPEPSIGVDFPSIIMEVTPEEFRKIQVQELKLPRGWIVGEELLRTELDGGGD